MSAVRSLFAPAAAAGLGGLLVGLANQDGKARCGVADMIGVPTTERVSSHAIGLLRLWDPRTAQKVLLAPSAVSPAPLCVCVLDS